MTNHNTRDCRTAKHLRELYEQSTRGNSTRSGPREIYGNIQGIEDPFNDFTDHTPNPEIHMVQQSVNETILDYHDTCIIDSGTTHSILRDSRLFHKITPSRRSLNTIDGPSQLEEGHGPATIRMPQGTLIEIASAIYSPRQLEIY